jgi:hypothetical protein
MANLSFTSEKYRYRLGIFLQKCFNGDAHEMSDGRKIKLDTALVGNRSFDLTKGAKVDGKAFETAYLGAFRTTLTGNLDKKGRDPKTGKQVDLPETVALTKLRKTDEYKDTGKNAFNKGNVAEGIFAAAIVARFIKKPRNTRVNEADIKKIIMALPKGKNMGTVSYKSPNLGVKVKDDVEFVWGLAQVNYDALVNPDLWNNWKESIGGSLNYANSLNVTNWSHTVYENGLYNKIRVLADGETAQTETKVDVKVEITNHEGVSQPVDINVSLKAGDVKQFGQFGGMLYETQVNLWLEWFAIHLPSFLSKQTYENAFGSAIHTEDAAKALMLVHKAMEPEVRKALKTSKGQQSFANAIQHHATKGEPDVELVQLTRGEAIVYTFKNIDKALKGVELTTSLKTSKAQEAEAEDLPIMIIYGQGTDKQQEVGEELLQIRVKRSGQAASGIPYYRTIFEKKSLMTKLIAGKIMPYFGSDDG